MRPRRLGLGQPGDRPSSRALVAPASSCCFQPLIGLVLPLPGSGDGTEPPEINNEPEVALALTLKSGPVVIEVDYEVDPDQARPFYEAMQKLQRARKRNGAFDWSLSRDIADPSLWTERYTARPGATTCACAAASPIPTPPCRTPAALPQPRRPARTCAAGSSARSARSAGARRHSRPARRAGGHLRAVGPRCSPRGSSREAGEGEGRGDGSGRGPPPAFSHLPLKGRIWTARGARGAAS